MLIQYISGEAGIHYIHQLVLLLCQTEEHLMEINKQLFPLTPPLSFRFVSFFFFFCFFFSFYFEKVENVWKKNPRKMKEMKAGNLHKLV